MEPVRTDSTNIVYAAEGCDDLPATIVETEDGGKVVETCWELTDAEVEQIAKDKRLYLYIIGTAVPPLLPSTENLREIG